MVKVFLDASVLFSAVYSGAGASRAIAEQGRRGRLIIITTETVVEEVIRNLVKFRDIDEADVYEFVGEYKIAVRESVTREEIKPFTGIIEEKDAHVFSGATLTQSDFLVTLDKKHINNLKIKRVIKKPRVVSPKELLEYL